MENKFFLKDLIKTKFSNIDYYADKWVDKIH